MQERRTGYKYLSCFTDSQSHHGQWGFLVWMVGPQGRHPSSVSPRSSGRMWGCGIWMDLGKGFWESQSKLSCLSNINGGEKGKRHRARKETKDPGGEGTWRGLSELKMEPLSAGPYKVQGLSVFGSERSPAQTGLDFFANGAREIFISTQKLWVLVDFGQHWLRCLSDKTHFILFNGWLPSPSGFPTLVGHGRWPSTSPNLASLSETCLFPEAPAEFPETPWLEFHSVFSNWQRNATGIWSLDKKKLIGNIFEFHSTKKEVRKAHFSFYFHPCNEINPGRFGSLGV